MTDLSVVPTGELLDAIVGRFDHAVFIGMQEQYTSDGLHAYRRRWNGNSHTCAGLSLDMASRVIEEIRGAEEVEYDPD